VPRVHRRTGEQGKSGNPLQVAQFLKKMKKGVDKPQPLCYNKYNKRTTHNQKENEL
jgi:hypothetical protein